MFGIAYKMSPCFTAEIPPHGSEGQSPSRSFKRLGAAAWQQRGASLCRAGIYYLFCCHSLRANNKFQPPQPELPLSSREIKSWSELQLTITSRCDACCQHCTCSRAKIPAVEQFVARHMLMFSVLLYSTQDLSSTDPTVTQPSHVSVLRNKRWKMEEVIHRTGLQGVRLREKRLNKAEKAQGGAISCPWGDPVWWEQQHH